MLNQTLVNIISGDASHTHLSGLGVTYDEDGVLNKESNIAAIKPGHRAPYVVVRKPGSPLHTRLYELTKNRGQFWILVFAGSPNLTSKAIKSFRTYIDGKESFTKRLNSDAFSFLTIMARSGLQPDEDLGCDKIGFGYYDVDHTAHSRYGITPSQGGVLVVRPDGILGYAAPLDHGGDIGKYSGHIIEPSATQNGIQGEFDVGKVEKKGGVDVADPPTKGRVSREQQRPTFVLVVCRFLVNVSGCSIWDIRLIIVGSVFLHKVNLD